MSPKQITPRTRRVREMAQAVVGSSKDLITIDEAAIAEVLAPKLRAFQNDIGDTDAFARDGLTLENELGLQVFFNVVNFCFKDPATGREYQYTSTDGKTIHRSTGLFSALAESGVDWNDLNEVARLSQGDWKRMAQLNGENTLYLGEERGERVTGFAKFLLGRGHETVQDFLQDSGFDAAQILEVLVGSGYFEDAFLKRAQVLVHGVDNVLKRRKAGEVEGVHSLTGMADYRVPQVLYNLGIVKLNPELKRKLAAHEQIESGSREELALRASVVVVGLKLSGIMGISESEVDGLLWRMSQSMAEAGELTIPHMIVATDKY